MKDIAIAESEFTIEAPVGFFQDGTPADNLVDDVKVVQFLLNAIPASERSEAPHVAPGSGLQLSAVAELPEADILP